MTTRRVLTTTWVEGKRLDHVADASAEGEARRRLEVGQHAAVAGKRETLDRLTREHESLRKAISAQELEMSRLAGGR